MKESHTPMAGTAPTPPAPVAAPVQVARDGRRPSRGSRALAARAAVVACAAIAALLFASAAQAAKTVDGFIGNAPGSAPTGDAADGGLFNTPRGVAVNNATGDVYVVDSTNHRVQHFDATGAFVRAWGRDVVTGGVTGFEVCTAAASCKAGTTGTLGGEFNSPQGIAVDQADGSVYVTDQTNFRVQKFDATGTFVLAFGRDVLTGGVTTTEVCTVAASCKIGTAGAAGGEFASTFSGHVAVVPAGAPNAGNVIVADPANRRVQEFTSAGAFVLAFGADVDNPSGGTAFEVCTVAANCKIAATGGNGVGQFSTSQPTRVAADATGAIYTVENQGNVRVQKFTPQAGPPPLSPTVFAPATLTGANTSTAPTDVAVNPANGNVLVTKINTSGATPACPSGVASVNNERRVLEVTSAGALVDTHLACSGLTNGNGLAFRPSSGRLYLSNTSFSPPNTTAHRVYMADDDGATPATVAFNPASNVMATSAILSGTLNSNHATLATNYSLEVSQDGVAWNGIATGQVPAGMTPQPISGTATDLRPNTLYRVRVTSTKGFGNPVVPSPELTFVTDAVPPEVVAAKASSLTDTAATVLAQINPHSTQTTYRIEYGIGYLNQSFPVPDASIGAGPNFVFVAQRLAALQPNTTYLWRVVATSATTGATTTPTRTFTTKEAPAGPDGRVYELVSPADKIAGAGAGEWYRAPAAAGHAGFAAQDGERFAVGTSLGSMLLDGAQAWASDWAFADRMSDGVGWVSHSPFTRSSPVNAFARYAFPHAATPTLSRVSWGTNNDTLTIFPEMASSGWSQFQTPMLSDWAGRWEVFGPTELAQLAGPVSLSSERLWEVVFSADGARVAATTDYNNASNGAVVRGLGGSEDPTHLQWPDLVAGRSIYVGDLSDGLADTFAGTGERQLVNVCTGVNSERTVLPARDGSGKLMDQTCPPPGAGRDARLVSDRGATMNYGDAGDVAGGGVGSLLNVVSSNGSRVFFMSPDPLAPGVPNGVGSFCSGIGDATLCPPQLYVRQVGADGQSVVRWISRAEDGLFGAQDATLTGQVRFEGATPDGDKVFFRTNSPLTADDPNGTGAAPVNGVTSGNASNSSWDLYRYDLPDNPDADPADGTLTRVSGGPGLDGDCNSPFGGGSTGLSTAGALRFVSDDGARAYFTCAAPLPGVPAASNGTIASPAGTQATSDATNLYLFDANSPQTERWRFVTRLPRASGALLPPVANCASNGVNRSAVMIGREADLGFQSGNNNCVNGVSDGSFITFFTDGRLTADDPATPVSADIYAYDLAADELIRITAPQGGVGGAYTCVDGGFLDEFATPPQCYGDPGFGGTEDVVRRGPPPALGLAADPLVEGDRVAFFQSRSRLVAEDTDDAYDVYQWRNGELSLVSTGSSEASRGAMYLGNDKTGRNVYFFTTDRLTWQDFDGVGDVYTARVGGGIPEPAPPTVCVVVVDGCQRAGTGAPTPTSEATPSPKDPGAGNAVETPRGEVSFKKLSKSQVGALTAGRSVNLKVKVNQPGKVSVAGTAAIRRKARRVLSSSRTATRSGTVNVPIKLSATGRKELTRAGKLRVSLSVAFSRAKDPVAATLTLKKAKPTGTTKSTRTSSRRTVNTERGGPR
jgi:DNA-binding beta-propeller fold protein YncE